MNAWAALTKASYRVYTRDRAVIFFTFVFPLVFLVTFGLVFRDSGIHAPGRGAIDGIAAGILSWGVASTSLFSAAFTLVQWRSDDILRLIRMTPTSLTSVLISRGLVALTIAGLQAVLFVTVAMLPPFGLQPAASWPAALPVIVVGVTAFLAIGVVVGCSANTGEGVSAIANCVMVPMAFLAGSFVPLSLMPSWLRSFATVLPLHYLNNGVSEAISGSASFTSTVAACGWLVLFAAVFCAIGMRMFRWSNAT